MRTSSVLLLCGIWGLAIGDVYNVPFTTAPLDAGLFKWEYSYDQQAGGLNPNYFAVVPAPDNSGNALRVNIYATDQPFQDGSPTCPRSELSGSGTAVIPDNIPYVVQWYSYVSKYTVGYDFSLAQVYGSTRPNIMLKFTRGQYSIWSTYNQIIGQTMTGEGAPYSTPPVSADLHEDMNRWVNFRMEFTLAVTGGYVRVYKDGVLIGNLMGDTSGGGSSYWKQGIYTQFSGTNGTTGDIICETDDTTLYIRDLDMVQGTTLAPLPNLSSFPTNPPTTTPTTTTTTTTTATTKEPGTGVKRTTLPTTGTTRLTTTTTAAVKQVQVTSQHTSPASKPFSGLLFVGYVLSIGLVLFSLFGPNSAQ